jgi:hypothetical protein
MLAFTLTASEAAAWVGLITAVGGVIVSVIGALKGFKADGKADVLSDRANALASHAQSLDRQITDVAAKMTPPPDAGNSLRLSGPEPRGD